MRDIHDFEWILAIATVENENCERLIWPLDAGIAALIDGNNTTLLGQPCNSGRTINVLIDDQVRWQQLWIHPSLKSLFQLLSHYSLFLFSWLQAIVEDAWFPSIFCRVLTKAPQFWGHSPDQNRRQKTICFVFCFVFVNTVDLKRSCRKLYGAFEMNVSLRLVHNNHQQ